MNSSRLRASGVPAKNGGRDMPPSGKAEQFLLFGLADRSFGVPFSRLAEVRTLEQAMPVFHPPDYSTGVMSVNGRLMPVLDLRVNFGLPARLTPETRLMVVFRQRPGLVDSLLGLLIDRVDRAVPVDPRTILPAPDFGSDGVTDFLLGTVECPGGARLLLDVDRLIDW